MGMLEVLFPFFIFPVIYASNDCQFSLCGNNSALIRFPFQLKGEQHPYCGYPGFNLICTNNSKTVLKLPYSGEFYVHNINYLTQKIQVYDPDDCLPKRLLSLNVSGSSFIPTFTRNYTFLRCPFQNAGSQFIPIDCLSNSTSFVSAVPSLNLTNPLPESCHVITRLSVPVARPEQQYEKNHIDELREDLRLTWDRPNCRYCESREQLCGFDRNNNNQLFCFSYQTGTSRQGVQVFRIITLCIAGPTAIFAIVMACCVCYKDRLANIRNQAIARSAAATISPAPQQSIVSTGLDESTIESYEKVVLGESRRLPGPNNGCCWICLSEYSSKETIRLIPECKHCFHAECIDEWLRINTTCPVCRNSPSPSPLHVTSINP